MACSLGTISNHTNGFDFAALFNVYVYLKSTCAPESDIFFQGTRMLTDAVCGKLTGKSDNIWSGWTPYPISDIWTRIVVWKLPLLQLISQFPRPPLGFIAETGVMMHLLGDPIDSVSSMLLTLAICQSRVARAKELCDKAGMERSNANYDRTWKQLAIIMISFDECGASEKVEEFCAVYLDVREKTVFETDIRHIYEETAGSLAADRQTRTLPVVLAEVFFVGGWIISLVKAASSEPNPTNWVNVEAQSIAISALFLWVTSTVVVGSIIGASQTEDAIPRILHAFEHHLAPYQEGSALARRPSIAMRVETRWCRRSKDRAMSGGAVSWRPRKREAGDPGSSISATAIFSYYSTAVVVVGSSLLVSAILSALVSPQGFNCRHIPEIIVFSIWLLSFIVEVVCENCLRRGLFWTIFWKDTLSALSIIAIIVIVQWGIMNRCSCWSGWGSTGLHLPQMPEVKPELMHFIKQTAPWIVVAAIVSQLTFCAGVICMYWSAFRVFVQRDDGVSNIDWLRRKLGTKTFSASRYRLANR